VAPVEPVVSVAATLAEAAVEVDVPVADPAEARPLVVVLHGRGGQPERFARRFAKLEPHARVVALGGPQRSGRGRAWLTREARGDAGPLEADELARASDALVSTLETLQAQYPTTGKPVLVGYSQGGMVALATAARHPEAVSRVIAVSAKLPVELAPHLVGQDAPEIQLLHGGADRVIPPRLGERTATRLRDAGYPVRFDRIPGEPHRLRPRHWRRILSGLGRELGPAIPS
jgi:phospholipase/carboxylesterase